MKNRFQRRDAESAEGKCPPATTVLIRHSCDSSVSWSVIAFAVFRGWGRDRGLASLHPVIPRRAPVIASQAPPVTRGDLRKETRAFAFFQPVRATDASPGRSDASPGYRANNKRQAPEAGRRNLDRVPRNKFPGRSEGKQSGSSHCKHLYHGIATEKTCTLYARFMYTYYEIMHIYCKKMYDLCTFYAHFCATNM